MTTHKRRAFEPGRADPNSGMATDLPHNQPTPGGQFHKVPVTLDDQEGGEGLLEPGGYPTEEQELADRLDPEPFDDKERVTPLDKLIR